MIVEKAFLDKLKEFGLNSYESKLWCALLSRGVATAGELADISSVPRSRSYDVLESLEKKGFIELKLSKPIKYVAVSPTNVLNKVRGRVEEASDLRIKELENVHSSKLLKELSSLYASGADGAETDISGCLKGRSNIHHHMLMLIKEAKKSITLVTTTSSLLRKYELMEDELKKASKRGVKIKIGVSQTKQLKTQLDALKKYASLVDVKGKSRFCIVDDEQLMLMLFDDSKIHKSYDVAVWIKSPYFAKNFKTLFEKA